MYRKRGDIFMTLTVAKPKKTISKRLNKTEWDSMADIAEKCMKSQGFNVESVRKELNNLRKSI